MTPEEEEFSSIKELSKNDTNYSPNSNEESKNESQNKSKDNKLTQEEDEFSFKQESSQNDTIHPPNLNEESKDDGQKVFPDMNNSICSNKFHVTVPSMDPIQLIDSGKKGSQLYLMKEALKLISSEKRHVTVVTIVGPYRSGKSYLLNRLMGRSDGFPLGSTVQAKTKGFWQWLGDFPSDKNRCLILLDVEGLADVRKGNATHDLKLFTMALLLSSMFIYNTKGNIDSSALDGLHLATKISEQLMSSEARKEQKDFARHFPHFIWAVRDHHLKLILNDGGKEVTSNEYLEHCLESKMDQPDDNDEEDDIQSYNKLRQTIRDFFPDRDCLTFPQPVLDPEKMEHLEIVKDFELNPKFKKAADEFVSFVLSHAKSKQIRGSPLNGFAFAKMIKDFLQAIECQNLSIDSTFKSITNIGNAKAFQLGIEAFEETLATLVFPVAISTFRDTVSKAEAEADKVFLENCIDLESNQDIGEKMKAQQLEIYTRKGKENEEVSKKTCKENLKQLFAKIEDHATQVYHVDGGFDLLKRDLKELKESYFLGNEELGTFRDETLREFEREKVFF